MKRLLIFSLLLVGLFLTTPAMAQDTVKKTPPPAVKQAQSELEKAVAERDRLLKQNRPKDALPWAQKVVDILRREKPVSLDLGVALNGLARIYFSLNDWGGADKAWTESLDVCEKAAPDSKFVGTVLHNLGYLAFSRRDNGLAQRMYDRSLAIFQKIAPDSLDVARCLSNLALLAQQRGDMDLAQKRMEEVLAIREKLAPNSNELAGSLQNLAQFLYQRGNAARARAYMEEALAIDEKIEPGSLDCAVIDENLGLLAKNRGDFALAQSKFGESLAIYEKLAPVSLGMAATLVEVGNLESARSQLDVAQRRYEASLQILDRLHSVSEDLADSLEGLGSVAYQRGDPDLAQRRYERALEVWKKLSPSSLGMAGCLNDLGTVAYQRGDLDAAKVRYEAAVTIFSKLAPDSLEELACLHNLGNIASARGDPKLARSRYQACLAIYKRLGSYSLDMAQTLGDIASVEQDLGDAAKARAGFEAALAIEERIAPDSRAVAATLGDLAKLNANTGELVSARREDEEARAIYERLSPDSLELGWILDGLGTLATLRGDQKALAEILSRQFELSESLLAKVGLSSSGTLGSFGVEISESLSSLGWSDAPQALYAWLPTLRGAGLRLQVRAKAMEQIANNDKGVRLATNAVQAVAKRESDLARTTRPERLDEKTWETQLVELRERRKWLEIQLATLLKQRDSRLGSNPKVTTEAVQGAVPHPSALVEYLKIRTLNRKSQAIGPDAYGAFVVTRTGKPRWFRLGNSDAIDSEISSFRQAVLAGKAAMGGDSGDVQRLGKLLYSQLIAPLGDLPNNLLIAPDASLYTLPFAALMDKNGRYLVETKSLSIVGSGRDLVEKPPRAKPGPPAVFAGPEFNLDVSKLAEAKAPDSSLSGTAEVSLPRGGGGMPWKDLSGASQEGHVVAAALRVRPVSGKDATQERLMSLQRPIVLHIATHGFFFPEPKTNGEPLKLATLGARLSASDNPMLRSGLVFAGANKPDEMRSKGRMDGWATALELSQMDLRGTELVVLSACDTGRGQYEGGEGVFGLQRAFRFAGAQSLIMSLFQVPDASTKALFTEFYRHWKPGMPSGSRQKALRNAQLDLLHHPATADPRNWAAFELMGDR